jgi:hypothetical protein
LAKLAVDLRTGWVESRGCVDAQPLRVVEGVVRLPAKLRGDFLPDSPMKIVGGLNDMLPAWPVTGRLLLKTPRIAVLPSPNGS